MNSKLRLMISALICTALPLATVGCEDSAARQRDEVQVSINQIGRELQKALANPAGGSSDDLESVKALNDVVAKLGQIGEGEPGQQAAKSLLTATALRELAMINADKAANIEAQQRAERTIVQARIDTVQRLLAHAKGMESVNADDQRRALQNELQSAKQRITELKGRIAQLEAPINERSTQNAADAEEVSKLRMEVGELIRRAQELGHADGFETYQRAATIDRQADKIEYEVAQREIDLQYELNPEHKLASSQIQQLQSLIQAVEAAEAQLDAFSQAAANDAAAARQTIKKLADEIAAALASIDSVTNGELQETYQQIFASLDKAASNAEQAARQLKGDDAHSARLLVARIREAKGRLYSSMALGCGDHQSLLTQLAELGPALGNNKYAAQLTAAQAATEEALENAKAAFAEARTTLEQVQARGDSVMLDAFRANLDAAVAAMEVKPVAPAPPAATPASSTSETTTTTSAEAPAGDGFATPEDAIAFIESLNAGDESASAKLDKFFANSIANNATGRKVIGAMRELASGMVALHTALEERFGADQATAALHSADMNMVPDFSNAKITPESEDSVRIDYTKGNGMPDANWLTKINGRWYFDMGKLTPENQQAIAMMDMVLAPMKKALTQTAKEIRDGKYQSAQEALQGFQQAIMSSMGFGDQGIGLPAGDPNK